MIDASKPNYSETSLQIEELISLVEKLEKNILFQIPQGITNEFIATKNEFLNWVDEIEFTIEDYQNKK